MLETINYRGLYIQCDYKRNIYYCSVYPEIKVNNLRKAKLLATKILRNIKGYSVPLSKLKY